MKLAKSSRHSEITGDFGESILLYLLSRHGFECARVDHTGIDLIARRPNSREVLGISVKSRSRQTGTGRSHLALPHDGFPPAQQNSWGSAGPQATRMPWFSAQKRAESPTGQR